MVVTHDLSLAARFQRQLEMKDGQLESQEAISGWNNGAVATCFSYRITFFKGRKRAGMVSLISIISTLGIMLGVAVLIIGLSAMNGFERELKTAFFLWFPMDKFIR